MRWKLLETAGNCSNSFDCSFMFIPSKIENLCLHWQLAVAVVELSGHNIHNWLRVGDNIGRWESK